MKIKTIDFASCEQYKTVVTCCAHIPRDDMELINAMIGGECRMWWIHQIGTELDGAVILRFGAVECDWEGIAEELAEYKFSEEFIGMLSHLHTEGFTAVHFDPDAPLLAGFHWYTDSGAKVIPLAYDLPILSFNDLDDTQRALALEYLDEDEEQAQDNNYFICDDVLYSMADFMRLDDNSELKEYGFSAYYGESNTSALFIELVDDNESVNVVRCI